LIVGFFERLAAREQAAQRLRQGIEATDRAKLADTLPTIPDDLRTGNLFRAATSEKSPNDVHQGAVLLAVLAENESGALDEAFDAFPKSARAKLRLGLKQARTLLVGEAHERGVETVEAML